MKREAKFVINENIQLTTKHFRLMMHKVDYDTLLLFYTFIIRKKVALLWSNSFKY